MAITPKQKGKQPHGKSAHGRQPPNPKKDFMKAHTSVQGRNIKPQAPQKKKNNPRKPPAYVPPAAQATPATETTTQTTALATQAATTAQATPAQTTAPAKPAAPTAADRWKEIGTNALHGFGRIVGASVVELWLLPGKIIYGTNEQILKSLNPIEALKGLGNMTPVDTGWMVLKVMVGAFMLGVILNGLGRVWEAGKKAYREIEHTVKEAIKEL